MNVLMLGWGKGSWQIRGQQLGAAIGARVTSDPQPTDWRWADLAVIVKRAEPRFGPVARGAGVPIVWDALDCWQQPTQNAYDEANARQVLANHLQAIRPAATIGATEAQANAALFAAGVTCDGDGRFRGNTRAAYLPHHSWPGLTPAPVRDRVQVVAYQGNAAYLGDWLGRISRACGERGWRFVVNPPHLGEADILVAFRDGPWDGWMCREWKSGVKLVNAIAAGRPILTQASAAMRELGAPGTVVETVDELAAALDAWADPHARMLAAARAAALAPAYQLPAIAARYTAILSDVRSPCSTT